LGNQLSGEVFTSKGQSLPFVSSHVGGSVAGARRAVHKKAGRSDHISWRYQLFTIPSSQ
jgi:hypothetical protein